MSGVITSVDAVRRAGTLGRPTEGAPSVIGRYYDPGTGQFISVDPAVDQTEAPYAYVSGDPVNGVDPIGLGCILGIACGAQGAIGTAWGEVNPFSSTNYFRQSAENGGIAASIVRYADPAYLAVSGYVGAYDAWENGCPLSTVFGDALSGTVGALGTVAFGYDAVLFGRGFIEGWNAAEQGGSKFAAGWRGTNMSDEDSFNYHFGKHGAGTTPEQYAQAARDWAANPTGIGTPVKLADGTTGMRYRTPGGGTGGILDSNGNIVTFWYR